MFRSVLSLLAAALTLTATPVSAQQLQHGPNSLEAHSALVSTIRSVGVEVFINPPACTPNDDNGRVSGFYLSEHKVMVICQDYGSNDMSIAPWTPNDLDTIRHEAHHIVQDCLDGLGDDSLVNMFPVVKQNQEDMSLLEYLIATGLPAETINRIVINYTERGASQEVIYLEYEAWATAHAIDANTISRAVADNCSAK